MVHPSWLQFSCFDSAFMHLSHYETGLWGVPDPVKVL